MLIFLSLVLFYLIVIDIRLAAISIFLKDRRRDLAVQRQGVLGSRWILFWGERLIGLKVRMETPSEPLPARFVMLANHQSLLDILVALAGFPDSPLRFVAKRELGRLVPGASRVLRYGRHALIHRKSNLRQTAAALKLFARRCERRHWCPVIFPEGTRSLDGKLKKFHPGAYRFVQEPLMLPTVVLAIDGGWKFSHFKDFLRKKAYFYRIRVVSVLPPPASPKGIAADLETARNRIQDQLESWGSGQPA